MEDRIDRRLSKHGADIIELRKDVDFFVSSSLPPKEKVFVEGKMLDAQAELTRIVNTAKSRNVLMPRIRRFVACASGYREAEF